MNMHRAVGFVGVVGTMLLGACFADQGDRPYPGDAEGGSGASGASGTGTSSTGVGPADDLCKPGAIAPLDTCGVFVDPTSGSDSDGFGTQSAPFQTWNKALASVAEGANIYVCVGTETLSGGQVAIEKKVKVWGGLNCTTWEAGNDDDRSTLIGASDQATLYLGPLSSGTQLSQIVIVGADSQIPSGSSIAAIVEDAETSFVNCELMAGATTPPEEPIVPGKEAPGLDDTVGGLDATDCTAANGDVQAGSVATEYKCSLDNVSGGNGGGSSIVNSSAPTSAPTAGQGPPGLGGSAGGGENSMGPCTDGSPGKPGAEGAWTPPDARVGVISSYGFAGVPGAQGGGGQPGGGGGGGGAALGKHCGGGAGFTNRLGATGGAGGSGGCGGQGGAGGAYGGSSIALVALNANVEFVTVSLTAHDGANGGDGSAGFKGGEGGNGGPGGKHLYDNDPLKDACAGGHGGKGGAGGPGGGGRGGHSLGIAALGEVAIAGRPTFHLGEPGRGGKGGAGAKDEAAGLDGIACEIIALNANGTGDCVAFAP